MKKSAVRIFLSVLMGIMIFISFFTFDGTALSEEEYSGNIGYFSDENGGFIAVGCNGERYTMHHYGSNGELLKHFGDSIPVVTAVVSSKTAILIAEKKVTQPLLMIGLKSGQFNVAFLSDISVDRKLIACDQHRYIYAADTRSPDKVFVYDNDGTALEEYDIGRKAKMLFCINGSNDIYAATDDGVIYVKKKQFISCEVPEGVCGINREYFWDEQGNIFIFDSESGFEKLFSSDYSTVCAADGKFYAAEGKHIYALDEHGNAESVFEAESDVEQLLASSRSVAYVCSGKMKILDISLMIKLDKSNEHGLYEPPKHSESSVLVSEISENKNSFEIRSEEYRIERGLIKGIKPGTTLAELKKNMEYGGNSIFITDHNGKSVKSGTVGTAWEIEFSSDGKDQKLITVVSGDITGEGSINSRDTLMLCTDLLENSGLDEPRTEAADMNHDGKLDCTDLYLLYCNESG